MDYKFKFVSTHKDIVEGFRTVRNAESGMNGWSRGLVLLLGLMWLLGFIFVAPKASTIWQLLIWLFLGSFIVYKIAVKPYVQIKYIKESNPESQKIEITFTDNHIEAIAENGESFNRSWEELEHFQGFSNGVVFMFSDGIVNWFPLRVFESKSHKERFVNDVVMLLNNKKHS
jgi:hypothetical protein